MSKKYHIRELEEVTGIKVHTIRMWEKRYNLIIPDRSDTNIRYYNEKTFKKFLLIAQLYHNKFKISEIAKLSIKDLQEKALLLSKSHPEYEAWETELLESTIRIDTRAFETILKDTVFAYNFNKAIIFLLLPFLYKIDIYWKANTLSYTHRQFAFENSYRFLHSAISSISRYYTPNKKKVFLYTNTGEHNIITLLFAEIILKRTNYNTLFFKNITNIETFFDSLKNIKQKHVVTIFPLTKAGQNSLLNLIKRENDTKFYIIDTNYDLDENIRNMTIINNLEEIEDDIVF